MIRKLLLVAAAIAMPASAGAVALVGTASVAGATPLTVTCTGLTGNQTSQTLSGCTGTGVGGTNATATGTETTSSKTIKWTNSRTTILKYGYKAVTPDKCKAPTGYTLVGEYQETSGTVSGGTAAGLIGGAASGTVCVSKKGTTDLVKNMGPIKL